MRHLFSLPLLWCLLDFGLLYPLKKYYQETLFPGPGWLHDNAGKSDAGNTWNFTSLSPTLTTSKQQYTSTTAGNTWNFTSVSPALTNSQQQYTNTTTGNTWNFPSISPALTTSQQQYSNTTTGDTWNFTSVSPALTTSQQQNTNTTAGDTWNFTSVSPALTTSQQQNTSTNAGDTWNFTSVSPALTTSQQQNTNTTAGNTWNFTSVSPALTTSQQQNTSTNAGNTWNFTSLSPTLTTSQQQYSNTTTGNTWNFTSVSPALTTSQQHYTNTTTGPLPSRTPTKTPLSPDQATQASASNDTITSPPITTITPLTSTQPTSTLHTFASITGTTRSPCQYSVLKSVNKTGAHVVNINGSKDQNYTIRIKDKHNEIRAEQISNQNVFEIPFNWLKPCTVYIVSVDDCELSGNNTFPSSKNGETVPKTVVTSVTDNEVCLKGVFTGIQWNLTECVKITEQNSCASTHTVVLDTCNYTMNVALPPVKPHINFNETIPSQFEWMNKPARCNAALLIINCINNENKNSIIYGLNTPVSLLPDTEYTCTGEYSYKNQHIKSNELSLQIKCDWQKNGRFQPLSSTSLEIFWNSLEEDKCSGIEWDSYSVRCSDGSSHRVSCTKLSGTSTVCSITGLLPYKKYACSITGTVNQKDYIIYIGNSATLSDKPIFRPKTKVHNPTHNSFEINCEKMKTDLVWNGGKGTFTAEITYNGEIITAGPEDKCLFTFSDLYYLATYDVKITAENKEGYSAFITYEAATKYNDKAVFGFLVFLSVVISIVLLFLLFKIYLHKRKRYGEDGEDEDCDYANVPMHVHRMETKKQTRG